MKQVLHFSENYFKVSNEDKAINKYARNSLRFNDQQTWIKKKSRLFDVMIGAYDDANVWELFVILYQLTLKHDKINMGLYRDEALAAFKNITCLKSQNIHTHKKKNQKIFHKND